jgi:hypothetical protein
VPSTQRRDKGSVVAGGAGELQSHDARVAGQRVVAGVEGELAAAGEQAGPHRVIRRHL